MSDVIRTLVVCMPGSLEITEGSASLLRNCFCDCEETCRHPVAEPESELPELELGNTLSFAEVKTYRTTVQSVKQDILFVRVALRQFDAHTRHENNQTITSTHELGLLFKPTFGLPHRS